MTGSKAESGDDKVHGGDRRRCSRWRKLVMILSPEASGDDVVLGDDQGDDKLHGGSGDGNDYVAGGRGDDLATGGRGDDKVMVVLGTIRSTVELAMIL